MAMAKFVLLMALVFMVVLMVESSSEIVDQVEAEGEYHPDRANYGPGSLKSYQCPGQCQRRCRRTHYKKPCLFFCNKCCKTCLCVPPGFYGNKGVCPCYNNWKTKRGGPKCP